MARDPQLTALRRRYRRLGWGELAASGVFFYLGLAVFTSRLRGDAVALWAALIPLLVILAQAGVYWLKARAWVPGGSMPASLVATYRRLRIINIVLLVLGLAGVIVWWPENVFLGIAFLTVWLFGLIEYLNYFVVRLSYPLNQWFAEVCQRRVPKLAQDIAR